MCFGAPLCYRQAQSRASTVARTAFIHSIKALKDPIAVTRCDTGAGVFDLDRKHPAVVFPDASGNAAARGRVFNGVIKQIHHNLTQDRTVPAGVQGLVAFNYELLLFIVRQHLDKCRDLLNQPEHTNIGSRQLNLTGIGSRNRQQTLDEPRQTPRFFEHAFDDRPVVFCGWCSAQADLAHGLDCGQWSSEFVGSIRRESTELLERTFQLRKRFVESAGKASNLILRVFYFQSGAQAFRVYLASATGHPLHWAKCAPRQKITAEPSQSNSERQP